MRVGSLASQYVRVSDYDDDRRPLRQTHAYKVALALLR